MKIGYSSVQCIKIGYTLAQCIKIWNRVFSALCDNCFWSFWPTCARPDVRWRSLIFIPPMDMILRIRISFYATGQFSRQCIKVWNTTISTLCENFRHCKTFTRNIFWAYFQRLRADNYHGTDQIWHLRDLYRLQLLLWLDFMWKDTLVKFWDIVQFCNVLR